MKGSISEFELGVLRARMLDAARSKAGRGELRLSVPFGYVWHRDVEQAEPFHVREPRRSGSFLCAAADAVLVDQGVAGRAIGYLRKLYGS
jgi:hypothetical protein